MAVHGGADVYATDGRVGKVDEFLVDASDNHVTHLVLREGHLWNQWDVMVPVSAVDRVEKETVDPKLDKHAIAALPATPFLRPKDWRHNLPVPWPVSVTWSRAQVQAQPTARSSQAKTGLWVNSESPNARCSRVDSAES